MASTVPDRADASLTFGAPFFRGAVLAPLRVEETAISCRLSLAVSAVSSFVPV